MALPTRPRFKAPPHPALDYRPPRSLRMLRAATIMFLTVASVTIIYVIWWFALAMSLNAGFEGWIEARTGEGWRIESGAREIDGFPFVLRLRIPKPVVIRPDGMAFSADILHATSLPLPFQPITLRASGALRFSLPAPPPGPTPTTGFSLPEVPAPLTFTGNAQRIEITLDGLTGLPEEWAARFRRLSLSTQDGSSLGLHAGEISLRLPTNPDADHTITTGSLSLHGEGVRLPAEISPPLGELVHQVDLEADLRGGVDMGAPPGAALASWRDKGGTVELRKLELSYGPMWLRTSGTLALDGDLQPVGATTAKMRGFFDAVEQMRTRGLIGGKEAVTAKLVLSAMARRAADGGPPVLNLPISIQDRILNVGPVPLLKLPRVTWPGTPMGQNENIGDKAT